MSDHRSYADPSTTTVYIESVQSSCSIFFSQKKFPKNRGFSSIQQSTNSFRLSKQSVQKINIIHGPGLVSVSSSVASQYRGRSGRPSMTRVESKREKREARIAGKTLAARLARAARERERAKVFDACGETRTRQKLPEIDDARCLLLSQWVLKAAPSTAISAKHRTARSLGRRCPFIDGVSGTFRRCL